MKSKTTIITTAIAAIFLMTASSCSKCKVCTKSSSAEVRVCEKDYNSSTQYGLIIDGLEGSGYTCKSSI